MDPVTVTCETCHARLRVRDPGVVGQIHACPKCGSMVYIVPPVGWSATPPSDTAQQPPADPPQRVPAVDCATSDDRPPAEPGADGVPLAPQANRWMLWSAGGAGLLVVGGLLAAIWTRSSTDDALPPAAETAPLVAPIAAAEAVSPSLIDRGEDASDGSADASAEEALANSLPSAVPAGMAATAATEHSEGASDNPGGLSRATVSADTSPAPAVVKFDPLDFDPSQLNLSSTGVAEIVPPTPGRSEDASDGLSNMPSEAGSVEAQANSTPQTATAAVQLGPASSRALRTRDVAGQLSLKIDAIDLPQVPLAQALELISDLADVPITLEPSALEMSGISPGFPVTLHAENVTIADLLTTALAQANLVYESRGGQIVVTKTDVDGRRTVNYRVDDLVAAGATDATAVAKLIERFVAPETWQSVGGTGTIAVDGNTLRVEQTERVLYQVLTFCERLRLARGLATRSRYPVERLRIEPPYSHVTERLSRKTTFTFLPWSRLADVFRHWEEADVTVLVDWPGLAEAGLAPSSPVACAVADRTWSDALDAVLTPLGLAWWAVDAQTLQITSRDAVGRALRIEFYPVSDRLLQQYASPEAMAIALVDEAKKQVADDPVGGAPIEIELDGPSRRLVVLATPEVHRYLSGRLSP